MSDDCKLACSKRGFVLWIPNDNNCNFPTGHGVHTNTDITSPNVANFTRSQQTIKTKSNQYCQTNPPAPIRFGTKGPVKASRKHSLDHQSSSR
eukprot:2621399-Karenia_brevis.AAC.1